MECEITPTLLWMSSSKRYIWYFTLHYGNLLSKQMPPVEGKYNNRKEISERRNPERSTQPDCGESRPVREGIQRLFLVQVCGWLWIGRKRGRKHKDRNRIPLHNEAVGHQGALISMIFPSLRALVSRIGGWPKKRLYSRLNWVALS